MRALLVLPTYEEADNIAAVLEAIRAVSADIHVLVVDDGSPDRTADIARAQASRLGNISVLTRGDKLGLGSAYKDGFKWGLERGYEVLVEMDADFSHDPRDLPRLLEVVASGADLAVGSRYIPGGVIPAWPWRRRALSKFGNAYARFALRVDVRDMTSGFRAYSSDVLQKVPLDDLGSDGYGFQIEMVREVGLLGGTAVEIPIRFSERSAGKSKMSRQIVMEALWSVTKWGIQDRLHRMTDSLPRRRPARVRG